MSLDQELLAQIDRYKDIMQKDPNSREFLTLAELYRKLGVAEEATKILRDGLTRHPAYVEARLAMARVYLTQGQVEDATREFEEVIHQDTGNFVAYKLLGEIAMQKQDSEKAAERFGAAYRIKPDDPECKVMLDYIGKLLGRDLFAQYGAGTAVIPPKPAAKQPAPPAATVAVAPEDEFGEFEEAEELEEISELEEEELEEIEEEISEAGGIGEFEPIEDVIEEEPMIESEEGMEEIEEIEDMSGIEAEEIEEIEDFDAEEVEEIEDFGAEEVEEIEEEPVETVEEVVEEELPVEMGEPEDELVSQIFQELSDSKYTSDSDNGLDEGNEGELDELMGLLESEEAIEEIGGAGEEEPSGLSEADENDLEGMIDLDGVPGMEELTDVEEAAEIEELPEEIEELTEEIQEVEELPEEIEEEIEELTEEIEPEDVEEFPEEIQEVEEEIAEFAEGFDTEEEIEELPEEIEHVEEDIEEIQEIEQIEEEIEPSPVEMIEEVEEEGEEKSSIFQDFGMAGAEEEAEEAAEGDVFQDFDFDVFEQELLKDSPAVGIIEEGETAESVLEEEEEAIAEVEATEEEAIIEEFESEEGGEAGELPSTSLAELYIKQDLFDEAMTIYQKLLKTDPANQTIKQVLEETRALQAYIEGRE